MEESNPNKNEITKQKSRSFQLNNPLDLDKNGSQFSY